MSAVETELENTSQKDSPFKNRIVSIGKDIYGVIGLLGLGSLSLNSALQTGGSGGLVATMIGITVFTAGSNLVSSLADQGGENSATANIIPAVTGIAAFTSGIALIIAGASGTINSDTCVQIINSGFTEAAKSITENANQHLSAAKEFGANLVNGEFKQAIKSAPPSVMGAIYGITTAHYISVMTRSRTPNIPPQQPKPSA